MIEDHTPTPKAQELGDAVRLGMTLLNMARYSLLELQHFVDMLDGDGMPIIGGDVADAITHAVTESQTVCASLQQLRSLMTGQPSVVDQALAELARKAVAKVPGALAQEQLAAWILRAFTSGQAESRDQVVAVLGAIEHAFEAPDDTDELEHRAANVLQLLGGAIRKIVNDDKFGKGEMLGRVDMFLSSPATVRDVASALRGAR